MFNEISVNNKEGEKYLIGKIGDISIIVNPYQIYSDYKIFNEKGDLLLDLAEHGFVPLDLI